MKVGLALSGGGVRGVAHLGIIKALEEEGVEFHRISATSAGAIVGTLYAAGYSVEDILDAVLSIKAFRLIRPALSLKGILDMQVVENFLRKYIKNDDFGALKIPVHITATDVGKGEPVRFSSGPLLKPLCASCCIPVLFDPVQYKGKYYIDGGIMNNLPVEPLVDTCEFIIGSHCNPISNDFDPRNARLVMERALMLAITQNAYRSKAHCNVFFEPKALGVYKVLDISSAQEIFDIGYRHAKEQLKQINLTDELK